ncbi:MAG: molybdate ABC transporter substrate-binding protein [Acidimicrobiales bacterium]
MNGTRSRTKRDRRIRRAAMAALGAAAMTLAACGSSSGSPTTSTRAVAKLTGSITVSAASSLTDAFGALATKFKAAHPGTDIGFNFGSSGTLATQITQGAPADVFASASPSDMATVQKAGEVLGTPVTFARNSLEIVVKPGNPLGIHSLADLTKAHVVAICVSTAPCGSTAALALKKAHVTIPASKISVGTDVDATFAEVTTGDADAAIVYVTNAKKVGDQGVGVPIPSSVNVTTSYPIAVLKSTKNRSLALAWVAYVLGPTGQSVLRAASFLPAH